MWMVEKLWDVFEGSFIFIGLLSVDLMGVKRGIMGW